MSAKNNKIYLDQKSYELLKSIFVEYPYTFYMYGSRVKGIHKQYSDIDIFAPSDVPLLVISEVKEQCDQSSLPYVVEITYECFCSKDFIEKIRPDFVDISQGVV